MTTAILAARQAGAALWRFDRVWLALLALFAALALALPAQALESLRFTAASFAWISPFLLLSVVLAAWLKAAGADQMIAAAATRRPAAMIVMAALFGALSPFCSCGVVPLMAALLAAGMPLSAVLAFAIASPIMDPEMFILMAVVVGLPFTVAKTVAAVAVGLLAGFATLALERGGRLRSPLRAGASSSDSQCGAAGGVRAASAMAPRWIFWRDAARRRGFREEAVSAAMFLAKWLLLAFALESLMVAWVPAGLVAETLGGTGWGAIPLAAALGVPAYLNGYAAIPLIGEMMRMGMAPGAALAFLVAGGVTSLPAALAVWALVRPAILLWYLALALVGSLVVGYGYQAILML